MESERQSQSSLHSGGLAGNLERPELQPNACAGAIRRPGRRSRSGRDVRIAVRVWDVESEGVQSADAGELRALPEDVVAGVPAAAGISRRLPRIQGIRAAAHVRVHTVWNRPRHVDLRPGGAAVYRRPWGWGEDVWLRRPRFQLQVAALQRHLPLGVEAGFGDVSGLDCAAAGSGTSR